MQAGPSVDLPASRRTGAQAVAHVIACQPAPLVLGMPGGYAMYIFNALHDVRDRVDIRLLRQESLATVMAEVHGRLTGRPAFVVAQGAWVLGNGGVGVMEAFLGASPMVLLVDATDGGSFSHLGPYQGGLGGYGSYDLPAALKAITKRVFVATDATQALQMTQLAIKHAVTGQPGPVAVVFNARSLVASIRTGSEPPSHPDRSYLAADMPTAPEAAIRAAAGALRQAQRPVIVAGNGVRVARAEALLAALAQRLGIPVATTPAGKGAFPEDDELAVGVIGGFGHAAANTAVGAADLVLALGTKLSATDTANAHSGLIDPTRQCIVQVDVEPLNIGWTFPVDVAVCGDLVDALPRLSAALEGYRSDGAARSAQAREGTAYFDRGFTSTRSALSARDIVRKLSMLLPPEAVVSCDAGENRLFVLRDYQAKAGGTVLQPNGGGGMGYAVPAAMAAAICRPGRCVVAVCGDGGISMSLHGLLSAVELGLNLLVVVLDNGALGWVHSGQGQRVIASELRQFDYTGIAAAMGCKATRVELLEDFEPALRDALSHPGVSIIVARTSRGDRYQDVEASLEMPDTYAVAGAAQG